ncbi:membrane protein [Ramlibacter tataouinensis]|uniref:Candidate membrane protein n=1 Tax=Ramlibacter tataouinensis (strain ATCC BAA-407 / DSM 14655 / LMG 21543 / TTB310) TaxID=365046 RepID=F5Y4K0_RAMTT|nr:membrane protein [Ramlibacter tataouinensis]AEG91318.1 candidate membrane protein [Ramlibacter tataouinensis TTB310]
MNALHAPLSWRPLAAGLAAAAAAVAYAVLCHWAASAPEPGLLEAAVFIVPLMAFALALAWRSAHRAAWLALWLAGCGALFLLRDRLGAGTTWVLLLQHLGFNALIGLGFARTLLPGAVPLVSRLAALVHGGALTPLQQRYTRGVTWAWTLYFAASSAGSVLLFALAPVAVWSAFVNLFSMPLMGAMFVGEFLVRVAVIPRAQRSGFTQAIAAYRRMTQRTGAPDAPGGP